MTSTEPTQQNQFQPARARVAPARKLITKPRDLIAEVEGRHVAVLPIKFGTHTFSESDGPTTVAEIGVVDLEAEPVRPIAALTISWRRVVAALRLTEPGVWQVGRLVREEEYQAVELQPPDPGFDLDRVAAQLGELETHHGERHEQLVIPGLEAETAEGEVDDDDIPY